MAGKKITLSSGDIAIYGRLINDTTNPLIVNAGQVETKTTVGGKEYTNQDDLNNALASAVDTGGSGNLPSGFLDDSGKINSSYLPSYVDDVIDVVSVDTSANTVTIGSQEQQPEAGKLYVDPNGNVYRYTGSKLAQVTSADTVGLAQRVTTLENRAEEYAYDYSEDDGLYLTQTINGNDKVLTQYNIDDFAIDEGLGVGQINMSAMYTIGIKAIDVSKITDPDTDSNSLFK